jgi:hypothetical protein
MKIINNSYINRNGAYYNSGGLIEGTQRILINHQTKYWQQGNAENFLSLSIDNIKDEIKINEAIYIGRIPTHFGHFIMEGMARLCDVVNINKPIIGYITDGYLPEGIKPTPQKEIRWGIESATNEHCYEIHEDETDLVEKLYVPTLPYHLSHSCSEPWRMSSIIKKIVDCARNENIDIFEIEKYCLSRYEDTKESRDFVYSDPTEPISRQIAKISLANELYGKVGSNTHLSIFAKSNAKTNWIPRGSYQEGDRNQLICDLVKTYNNF